MTLHPQATQRELRKQKPPRHIEIDLKSKIAFWSLLSKLRKEGLITDSHGQVKLTKSGKEYLREKENRLSLGKIYPAAKTTTAETILVIFDIPEDEKHKRRWLRFYLRRFGFKPLQKSVWQGTTALPKEFIKDLKKYEILPYVHIFTVKRKGTL